MAAAGCGSSGAASDPASAEREVRATAEARAAAIRDGRSRDAFNRPDYVGTLSNGRIVGFANASSLPATPGYAEKDVAVRVAGNAAVVTGVATYADPPRTQQFVRLWVHEGGRWQVAVLHGVDVSGSSSPLPVTRALDLPPDAPIVPTTTGAEAEVAAAQTARDAMFKAQAVAAYEQQTALDARRISPSGQVAGRAVLIDEFKGRGTGPVLGPPIVRIFGDLAAVFSTQNAPPQLRTTRIWVREEGRWKFLLGISSPIATAAPAPDDLRKAMDARTAAQDARNPDALAALTGDEFTAVNADGVLLDRAGRLRELRQQPVPATPPVRTLESAMVYGTAAVTRVRTATGYNVGVWALKPEGWRHVAAQVVNGPSTPSPAPPSTTPGKEPPWTAPPGLSSDARGAFDAHVRIQESGAAGVASEYTRHTANEFIRLGPLGASDRATLIARVKGRSGRPHDSVAVSVWDRVAVIRWRETGATTTWVMRVMTRNPWGWQQAITISTDVAAKQRPTD